MSSTRVLAVTDRAGRLRHWQLAVCLLLGGTLLAQPAPLVLLPPAVPARVGDDDLREAGARRRLVLALYLHDWLARAPEVQLVDEAQANALSEATGGPAWLLAGGDNQHWTAINAILPVTAVLRLELSGEQVTLRVERTTGQVSRAWPVADNLAVQVAQMTAMVGDTLGISPASAPYGGQPPTSDAQYLEDHYVAQRLWAAWLSNSGEARLRRLQPHLARLAKDPAAAAGVLEAALWLSRDSRKVENLGAALQMARQAFYCLLGTPHEEVAWRFCASSPHARELLESELVAMVAKVGLDALEADLTDEPVTNDAMSAMGSGGPKHEGVMAIIAGPKTPAQLAGALRCLGAMKSPKAAGILARTARAEQPLSRQATAQALGYLAGEDGREPLRQLAKDPELSVALAAGEALLRRGETAPGLAALARQGIAGPQRDAALAVLAAIGEPADADLLVAALTEASPERRRLASSGLLRLGLASEAQLAAWLADPATSVVQHTLANLPAAHLAGLRAPLMRLGNHPHGALAEAARLALHPLLPADVVARASMEMAFEHPLVRRQWLLQWRSTGEAQALLAATTNSDALTRALALRLLAELPDGSLAAGAWPAGLADPHRRVRLQAAAVAARLAVPEQVPVLRAALTQPQDTATRWYLEAALARIAGQAAPATRVVNRVALSHTQSFNCGWAPEGEPSAFDGFYLLNLPPPEAWPAMHQAQAAGKIFLARANQTARNPVQVWLTPGWRDGYWLGLEAEFGQVWNSLDGVVLGEESMYFRPWDAWAEGWRLFCREAGLEARQVAGDRERLSEVQQRAWLDWEQRLAIAGFNEIHDYLKLSQGQRAPGFQVATFMPDQNGPCTYDREWRFDIAAGYEYGAPSRSRYAAVRRLKSTWPERPVLWLNQGKVGVGLNLNQVNIGHATPVPTQPLHQLTDITVADSVSTWLAGGHTGLFAIYLFVHVGWKGEDFGRWVRLEDLTPGSPVLAEALAHSFKGLAEAERVADQIKSAKPGESAPGGGGGGGDLELTLDDPGKKADPYAEKAAKKQEALRLGMLLERQLIQDGVNLLAGVPFPAAQSPVMLVGPKAMRAPGFDLANTFDCHLLLNHLATDDLTSYRLIGISGQEQTLLRDETLTALRRWLTEQPGLLYIHGWLNSENTDEASTVADMDGRLAGDWPWEGALKPVMGSQVVRGKTQTRVISYQVTEGQATVVHALGGEPVLVWWRGDGMKGGVLFDAGQLGAAELRPHLEQVQKAHRIGVALGGPIGNSGIRTEEFEVWSACGAAAGPLSLAGLDFLSGQRDPELPKGRSAAFLARNWRGRFALAGHGLAVLASAPLSVSEVLPDGLRVQSPGVLRVMTQTGQVRVTAEPALPRIPADKLLAWLLTSHAPGQAELPLANGAGQLTLLRSPAPLVLRAGP